MPTTPKQGIGAFQDYITQAGAYSGPTGYQSFMSPYQQDVIDATMAEYDTQAQKGLAGIGSLAAKSGNLGGGREGVQRAVYDAETAAQMARLEADLRSKGFAQAQDQAARAFDMQTGLARLQPELAAGLQKSLSGNDASYLHCLLLFFPVFINALQIFLTPFIFLVQ